MSASKRPIFILTAVFIVLLIAVVANTREVTKDPYEGDDEPEVADPGTGVAGGAQHTTQTPPTQQEIEARPWLSLRMLRHVLPVHYDVTMFPDFYENGERFYGHESIELSVLKPTKFILVHVHTDYMNVTSAEVVDNVTGNALRIKDTFVYKPHEFYVIEMSEVIQSPVVVKFGFEGSLTKNIVGIYKATYLNTETNQTRSMAASKFSPTFARQAFPCFDEPDMKAEFTVSLVHRPNYTALSNMPQGGQSQRSPGFAAHLVTRFQRSVKMSTYLVTFVVGEFAHLSATSARGVPIRAFATQDKVQQTRVALEMAKHTLDKYETLFKLRYPLPKQDLIAIPEFVSGALENWGLIVFRESLMLYDNTSTSLSAAEDVAKVVAHEMAHMWFGNLVTMAWWNDLWLNEGFATYMAYIGAATKQTTWGLMEKFLISDFYRVMPEDSRLSSHPIIVDVTDPAQINSVFDTISYSKGASVIRMLMEIMGEAKFFQGVSIYLKQHQWGNARTDDLWNALSSADSHFDVKHIMDTWTMQDGYPYINITISTSGAGVSTIKATQKRFLIDPAVTLDTSVSPFGYKWYVPLDFKTSSGMNGTKAMDLQDTQFSGSYGLADASNWIKFNADQRGFYRVLYPESMWKSLSRYLKITKCAQWTLSVEDRAGLINDALNFASAGMLPYSVPLDMMFYLAEERHIVPWQSFFYGGVSTINRLLIDDPDYAIWKRFISNLTQPVVQRLGFSDDGKHIERQVRALVMDIACSVDEPFSVSNVNQMFRNWLDKGEVVSVNIRRTVYKYGMINVGTDEDFDKIWNKYLVENSPQEKNLLLQTLCYSRQPHLVSKILTMADEGKQIKTQDFFQLIYSLGDNTAARGIVWDWARANYQALVNRFTVNNRGFGMMVYYMTRNYNTEFKLKEVENHFRAFPEEGTSTRYRKMALESIRTNIEWMAKVKPQIISWLKKNIN